MPSVSELFAQIKGLSLAGGGGTGRDDDYMRYLNMTYATVLNEVADLNQRAWESETVAITNGSGTLSKDYMALLQVKDISNGRILEPTNIITLEEEISSLDATGSPAYYYREGTTDIKTYPLNDASVKVRGVAFPATLTTSSAESELLIPPQFHDVIVWGTLFYITYDERDKGFSQEVNVNNARYSETLGRMKEYLVNSQPGGGLRVKQYGNV